jgi:hypothetical protein
MKTQPHIPRRPRVESDGGRIRRNRNFARKSRPAILRLPNVVRSEPRHFWALPFAESAPKVAAPRFLRCAEVALQRRKELPACLCGKDLSTP